MKTGWPPGLLQDDCKALSKWFAGRLGARQQLKEMMMNDPLRHPERATDSSLSSSPEVWVCPWAICNHEQAQECRATNGIKLMRPVGCGSRLPFGVTQPKQIKKTNGPEGPPAPTVYFGRQAG